MLGDCYGSACAPLLMETTERALRGYGYVVNRNTPYAGGFTTSHQTTPAAAPRTSEPARKTSKRRASPDLRLVGLGAGWVTTPDTTVLAKP